MLLENRTSVSAVGSTVYSWKGNGTNGDFSQTNGKEGKRVTNNKDLQSWKQNILENRDSVHYKMPFGV